MKISTLFKSFWVLESSVGEESINVLYLFTKLNNIKLLQVTDALKESESEVTQSCPTLCNPVDCSLPGSSIHGIFQARVLEWVAIPFSRGSSRSRDRTQVSRIVGRHFTVWDTREASKWVRVEIEYWEGKMHKHQISRVYSLSLDNVWTKEEGHAGNHKYTI